MRSLAFIFVSIVAGALSGIILSGINLFVVEPYTDKAIEIEAQRDGTLEPNINSDDFDSYRNWQKSGTFFAGVVLGLAYGAILGVVYGITQKHLPFSGNKKKAIFLALVICLTLFVVPFIKYPANPPGVGDPGTIDSRQALYVQYQFVSCMVTLGISILYYRIRSKNFVAYIIPVVYILAISIIHSIFPQTNNEISIPVDLVNSFRIVSAASIVTVWFVLGIVFGLLWNKLKPNDNAKITTM
ncbi:MAG: CbtA family protein [Thermoproteota archaeon]|nr:CbtA family protein [Thermoproteota archaeon]